MQVAEIVLVFDYYYWATKRILDTASQLGHEQFVASSDYNGDSLRDILVHTMSAERRWRWGWQGQERPPVLDPGDFPTVAAVAERWGDEERQMRDWLNTLNHDDLQRTLDHPRFPGRPLWQYMLHVANHGTQHRSEAAMLLTSFGHSPGDLDLVFFVHEP